MHPRLRDQRMRGSGTHTRSLAVGSPQTIILDGASLARPDVVKVAYGARVALDGAALGQVRRRASEIADAPDDAAPGGSRRGSVAQGAARVDDPLPVEVVRAMLAIRINALLRGRSRVRVATLGALADILDRGVVPVIPRKVPQGTRDGVAPVSRLGTALLGLGDAFFKGERMPAATALEHAGLKPISLSFDEDVTFGDDHTQMLAVATLALDRMQRLLRSADMVAAMGVDFFGINNNVLDKYINARWQHTGCGEAACHMRQLLDGAKPPDVPPHLAPRFGARATAGRDGHAHQAPRLNVEWEWIAPAEGHEVFHPWFLRASGEGSPWAPDTSSLFWTPRVHGAVRDAVGQACRVVDSELNSDLGGTPPDGGTNPGPPCDFRDISLALVMGYVRSAVPALGAISEQRTAMLVDAANAAGANMLTLTFTGPRHAPHVQSVDVDAEPDGDDVVTGESPVARDTGLVFTMADELARVLALEFYTAVRALAHRQDMIDAVRAFMGQGPLGTLAGKIGNAPEQGTDAYALFLPELTRLFHAFVDTDAFRPGSGVAKACAVVHKHIGPVSPDQLSDADFDTVYQLVTAGSFTF